ncbi:MAG: DUF4384 domain-containing protein [Thermodesulfobacteriota bacterium]
MISLAFLLAACANVDPRQVDVQMKEEPPETKLTSFTDALTRLGTMTEIYGSAHLKLQSQEIADNTGTAGATGGEIPRDVTEILQSTLNAIGGRVTYIPYNPSFIQNQMVTGYSSFDDKIIPDVVISGGITEFDRGLETRGNNIDAGAQVDWTGSPSWVPSTTTAVDYGAGEKFGLASITLDFNMIDFRTMTGIARMQTVNTIKVHKALSEQELGITLFGPTFGLKGSIKKVQGRHAAVRMLVQLSMIQIVGKYLVLPYWNLLPNADPDQVVLDGIKKLYYDMAETDRIIKLQELLFIMGYDVSITGELDQQTIAALQVVRPEFNAAGGKLDKATFTAVYLAVPTTDQSLERRLALNRAYEEASGQARAAAPKPSRTQSAPAKPAQAQAAPAQQAPAQQVEQPPAQAVAAATPSEPPAQKAAPPPPPAPVRETPAPAETPRVEKQEAKSGISGGAATGGRMLSEEEW